MNGLNVNDLVNLTNTGALKTHLSARAWLTACANADDLEHYRWQLWFQPLDQTPVMVVETNNQPGFTFNGDHQLVYTTVNTQTKHTRLHFYDVKNYETSKTVLLKDHQLKVLEKLAGGQFLLGGRTQRPDKEPNKPWHELKEVPYWSNEEGLVDQTRRHLWVFNSATEQLNDLLPQDFDCSNYWYQDGQLFLCGVSYKNSRPFKDGLYKYDFVNQELQELVRPNQYRVDTIALLKDQLFVLASNCKIYGMGENPNFYRYSGHTLHLVAKWDHNVGNIVVNDMTVVGGHSSTVSDGKLYFVSTVIDHTEVYSFDGQHINLTFKWPGAVNSLASENQRLVFTATTADQPQQVYQYDGSDLRQVTKYNRFLQKRSVATMHEFEYYDSTNRQCHGWVLYPVNYQSGKKYPAVLEVHGGPRATYGTSFFHEMQVLANAGYFVLFTNLHGSEGQGDEYADLRGRYGQVDYADLMAFTDAVLKQYVGIDPTKVGITGGSYGGYMTNWVIGHTNRFKAAVSQRSIATWVSMMISDIGPEFVTDQLAASLDQENGMQTYWQHSPLSYVHNVQTPTLFLHSDHDFRCPIPEGYQMFQSMKLRGVPTKLVVFHGANHDLSRDGRPDQRMKRLTEMVAWFNKYLK